jgi:hypothetical protein
MRSVGGCGSLRRSKCSPSSASIRRGVSEATQVASGRSMRRRLAGAPRRGSRAVAHRGRETAEPRRIFPGSQAASAAARKFTPGRPPGRQRALPGVLLGSCTIRMRTKRLLRYARPVLCSSSPALPAGLPVMKARYESAPIELRRSSSAFELLAQGGRAPRRSRKLRCLTSFRLKFTLWSHTRAQVAGPSSPGP